MTTSTTIQNNIDWPSVYITADASQEPFEDLTIVTAKSEYETLLFDRAVEILTKRKVHLTTETINEQMAQLVNSEDIFVTEYVKFYDDKIVVCMDIAKVDDDCIWKALDMVYNAVSSGGNWHSSKQLTF